MYYRIIHNDINKSKVVSLITMLFITVAALLISLVAVLIINLSGAIDTLMTQAKTPHFLQMHSGDINYERMKTFAEGNSQVDEYQILEFLNLENGEIVIDNQSLLGNVQDNGLCIQSDKFDFLLDLNGTAITVSDGEIYVPICYWKDGTAQIGDRVKIYGVDFKVAGFLRDSQMNSLLSSSKRFLVSQNDYAKVSEYGKVEYLIEFLLIDISKLGAFEADYNIAGLEANGPTITYPLFKVFNAISDGLMIAVILLVSGLVVFIAFMCIRFTLLAKIEEEYREIGVMKAIGLRITDIKKIYIAKYTVITGTGCLLGFTISFGLRGILLKNIRLYMGDSKDSSLSLLFALIGVFLIFVVVLAYVNRVLKRFRTISAAEAIRFGISQENKKSTNYFLLSKSKLFDTNIFLGMKDVLIRKKLYVTMFFVIVLATFMVLIPQNLYHTISSKEFITYMGIGSCDLRIDIQQVENILDKADIIKTDIEKDKNISKYVVLTTESFLVKMEDGTEKRIKIELGDHSIFPVNYIKGRAPTSENDLALSVLNSDELGKQVGDAITITVDRKDRTFTVCGIYNDITNGGKTAKATFTHDTSDIMWCVISAELVNKSLINNLVSDYSNQYSFGKVTGIDNYIIQTFHATLNSIRLASYAATIVALIIITLITILFMKMLIIKDKFSISVMKALGFTNGDIIIQYVTRSMVVLILGILTGSLLANTMGEKLVGIALSMFGAASFQFVVSPVSAYLLYPLMMAGFVLIATMLGTSGIDKIKISEHLKE